MTSNVLFVSGHRTDSADRSQSRFPEWQVGAVEAGVRAAMERWGVGAGWQVITGGARGADLLVAREALERGAQVRLCLAMAEDTFIERSVRTTHPNPGVDWVDLFTQVRSRAQVDLLPADRQPADPVSSEAFARTNEWMLDQLSGRDDVYALLVWDGKPGSVGGTGGVLGRVNQLVTEPGRCHIIDPTYRAYEARQDSPGPKRILALDGGGLRGVISLEILARIEVQLRTETGDADLVLADYFDYIAGTSTGAIIATGLALGKPVAEIRDRYHRLGHAAFRSSVGAWSKLARYSAGSVHRQLVEFFGPDLVLGDPRLRTLLLIVMHNTGTDSPWLLSNCTRAKYNLTDRLLPRSADRNLDLPLLPLVRASTAAPTYFPPQLIQIGNRDPFIFQDGGVTAFNNPALIAAVMATLPAYRLRWRKGKDDLLVVSVGTGSSAATGRRRRTDLMQALSNLGKLTSVFMNGAAFSQDLLCRVVGDCRFGPKLDNEIGRLMGQQFEPDEQPREPDGSDMGALSTVGGLPAIGEFFSYVRYDADLTDTGLAAAEIDPKHWKAVRQLAAVAELPNLVTIGARAADDVDIAHHFSGFLRRAAS